MTIHAQADTAVDTQAQHVPGQGSLGPAVEQFDDWVDARLERLRGNRFADALFINASRAGEFSLLWHGLNVARGMTRRGNAKQVPILAVALCAESVIVNQGIKRLFRRTRPTTNGDPRYRMRTPLSSSFPSGHASAAAFAATVLSGWSGRRGRLLWWPFATIVAISRAYVRIHHASDVVAGFATGAVLGRVARRIVGRRGLS